MPKHSFNAAVRFAVYVTHGERCYLCSRPLDLKTMEVDHVKPEVLNDDPDRLAAALRDLGRPSDFEINSFANWMPACRSCNAKKKDIVFELTPLIQVILQRGAAKAAEAQALAEESVSRAKIANALNVLERAADAGELDEETKTALQPLVSFQSERRVSELAGKAIRLTPLYEVVSEQNGIRLIRGPYGVGGRPAGPHVHSSFDCPNCGAIGAWSGARCVICGEMNDD